MKNIYNNISIFLKNKNIHIYDKIVFVLIHLIALSIILSIALVQLFCAIVFIIGILQLIKNPQRIKSKYDLAVFIFIIVRIASIIFAVDLSLSIKALYTEIPYYLLFYILINQKVFYQKEHIYSIIFMLVIGAFISSAYGVSSVLLEYKFRAESITSGYYTFGSYIVSVFAIILFLGKSELFKNKRWIWYALVIIFSIATILTQNRIHWGILFLLLLIVGIIQERLALTFIIIGFIIMIFIMPSILIRFQQTINFKSNLSGRDLIWDNASKIIYNKPFFGYGQNSFKIIFDDKSVLEQTKIASWHNDYLQIYLESGIIGLIGALFMIFTIYIKSILYYLKNKKILLLALLASISTIFISSITGAAFSDTLIRIDFILLLSLLVFSSND